MCSMNSASYPVRIASMFLASGFHFLPFQTSFFVDCLSHTQIFTHAVHELSPQSLIYPVLSPSPGQTISSQIIIIPGYNMATLVHRFSWILFYIPVGITLSVTQLLLLPHIHFHLSHPTSYTVTALVPRFLLHLPFQVSHFPFNGNLFFCHKGHMITWYPVQPAGLHSESFL